MKHILALTGLLAVAACAGPDTAMLEALEPEGDGFPPALARAYRAFALELEAEGHHAAAAVLGEKARRAAYGWVDGPETVSYKRIATVVPAERVWFGRATHERDRGAAAAGANRPPHPEVFYSAEGRRVSEVEFPALSEARAKLVAALADGGRHANPAAAAAAQAAFDCWAAAAATGSEGTAKVCEARLAEPMAALERGGPAPYKRREASDMARLPLCIKGVFDKRYAFSFHGALSTAQADALDRALMEADRHPVCVERGVATKGGDG